MLRAGQVDLKTRLGQPEPWAGHPVFEAMLDGFWSSHSSLDIDGNSAHPSYFLVVCVALKRHELATLSPCLLRYHFTRRVLLYSNHSSIFRKTECSTQLKQNLFYKYCLVVWNIWYFSILIGNVIIPTDELIFFRGLGSTTNQSLQI